MQFEKGWAGSYDVILIHGLNVVQLIKVARLTTYIHKWNMKKTLRFLIEN